MVIFDDMAREVRPLSTCLQRASEDGYNENFKFSGDNLWTEDDKHSYDAEEINIDNYSYFDGHAPGDNSVVYLVETSDGRRGVLIDVYGPYAQTRLASFIRKINEYRDQEKVREKRSWKEFLRGY